MGGVEVEECCEGLGVDITEICVDGKSTRFIEGGAGEAGPFAEDLSAVDGATDCEHEAAVSMICAKGFVFENSATKFG